MKITVLIENQSTGSLHAEHGLSLYVEQGEHRLLLDAGTSGIFVENAAKLGCPLEGVHIAALSHGHYDHSDGFPSLFCSNDEVKVCARPAVMQPQYAADGRYIGLSDPLRGEYAERFDLSDEQREILPGLWLVPDPLDHEQSLVAETAKGLVVMNSCCHAGADIIVADVLNRFPGSHVHALIGGLHLMGPGGTSTLGMEPERIAQLARTLTEDLGVDQIYTGHCTGTPGYALLAEAAPGHVFPLNTGTVLEF